MLWHEPWLHKKGTNKVPGDLQATSSVGFCLHRCDIFSEHPLFFFMASLYISLCIPMKGEVGHDSEKKDVQFLPQILQEADLRHPVKLSWKDSRGRDTCQTLILIKRTPDALDFLHFGIPFEPSSARPLVYFWRYCLLLIKPRFIGLPINPLMALLHLLYVPFVSCWVSWSLFNVFGLRGMCL